MASPAITSRWPPGGQLDRGLNVPARKRLALLRQAGDELRSAHLWIPGSDGPGYATSAQPPQCFRQIDAPIAGQLARGDPRTARELQRRDDRGASSRAAGRPRPGVVCGRGRNPTPSAPTPGTVCLDRIGEDGMCELDIAIGERRNDGPEKASACGDLDARPATLSCRSGLSFKQPACAVPGPGRSWAHRKVCTQDYVKGTSWTGNYARILAG